MTGQTRRVRIGRIVGVTGLQGWVKLESDAEPRTAIFDYRPWSLLAADGSEREYAEVTGRSQGKGVVAKLPDIDDRDAAAALVGSEILVPRSALPPPEPGSFYWTDLEGLQVTTVAGRSLGEVSHLVATGANDVLVVRGERERLIPFLRESVIRSVDLDAGRIVVDWDPDF